MYDAIWKLALTLFWSAIQASSMQPADKISLSSDTQEVKAEIAKIIPAGTSIGSAQTVMQRNGFECQMMTNSAFSEQERSKVIATHQRIDYLLCDKQRAGIVCRQKWQIAIVHHNAIVKNALVSYGTICL